MMASARPERRMREVMDIPGTSAQREARGVVRSPSFLSLVRGDVIKIKGVYHDITPECVPNVVPPAPFG